MTIYNPETYRGFYIYETPGQINAKPTDETKEAHPGFVPIAARSRENLLIVIDFQYEDEARKAWEAAVERRASRPHSS